MMSQQEHSRSTVFSISKKWGYSSSLYDLTMMRNRL